MCLDKIPMKIRNFKMILKNQYGSELGFLNLSRPSSLINKNHVPCTKSIVNGVEHLSLNINEFYENMRHIAHKQQKASLHNA